MSKMLDDIINTDETELSDFEKENYILMPLLDEIDLIEDQGVKYFVRAIMLRAGCFWDAPSTYDGTFPPDEGDYGGLLLHTRRVVRAVSLLADSYSTTQDEKDVLIAAAILHDVTKFIDDGTEGQFPKYDPMYPYTVDELVRLVRADDQAFANESQSSTLYIGDDLAYNILRLIRTHRGPWSPIPETVPINNMEMILHIADHLCSKLHYILDGEEVEEERWLLKKK